ncbi:hypothetical protein SAMN04488002_0160 [Litoreibacter janthinus]|uniref:Uncharacterized protein n=1 Tax=Litoreibacter janthinus TaxID=670154 RepID=A0A1I6FS05_9RHOB|nr:hypothetical protein SAMN04488002_0160 [Litoreibacter janthinus]
MRIFSRLVLCGLATILPYEIEIKIVDWLVVEVAPSIAYAKGENSGKGNSGGDDDDGDDDDDDDDDEDDDEENTGRTGNQDGDVHSKILRIEKINGGVRLNYANGSQEVIRNGKYERRNASGRVIERRRARGSDIAHVRSLVGRGNFLDRADSTQPAARATRVTGSGRDIDVLFSNGWRERIEAGRYVLTDQFGRAVVKRKATNNDWVRLQKYRK